MIHARSIPFLAALLLLTACAATPVEYRRPPLPGGLDWPGGWQATASPAGGVSTTVWWTAFGDPGLDALVPVVLAANNDVLAASLRARRALLEAGLAGLPTTPSLSGSVEALRQIPLSGGGGARSVIGTGLALSYEVDLWGRIAALRDAAGMEALATAEDLEAARLTVIAATLSTWWRLAHVNQSIESARRGLETAHRTREIVTIMRRAQTVSDIESLEMDQAIEGQLAALGALARERDIQLAILAVLLNGAENPAPEPEALPAGELPPLSPGLPADLISRRPDLRAAELRLRATLRLTDERRSSYFPRLTLSGSLSTGGDELARIIANPVGVLASHIAMPFLNLKEMGLTLRVSEVQYEEAVATFRDAVLGALSEVATGLSARNHLSREERHLSRSLALLRQVGALYEVRLKAGSIALRTLLEAQERSRQVENAVIDNRLFRLLNEATLYRALGGGPLAN